MSLTVFVFAWPHQNDHSATCSYLKKMQMKRTHLCPKSAHTHILNSLDISALVSDLITSTPSAKLLWNTNLAQGKSHNSNFTTIIMLQKIVCGFVVAVYVGLLDQIKIMC